ncbi:ankyrin repeat domain-containing protein [Candidatus Protochlamydia phocaeensis]|uniref:ankyrin repeat domain-containing protein n=1 Tax=Candidatus Protochlamydia phocaeensis TaxID=1414722 RepID=UPI000838C3B2|nr:ankyrin repeat domain-containing protein [Candidatus Protochlamydia phocaeensis]
MLFESIPLQNLSFFRSYECSPDMLGHVLEYADVATLYRTSRLSRSWKRLFESSMNQAWSNLFQRLWNEKIPQIPGCSPYWQFNTRFRALGLHSLNQCLLALEEPDVIEQIDVLRRTPTNFYFNSFLLSKKRHVILKTPSIDLANLLAFPFAQNLDQLTLPDEEKQRLANAAAVYRNYNEFNNHFGNGSTLISRSSSYRDLTVSLIGIRVLQEGILLSQSQNNHHVLNNLLVLFNTPDWMNEDCAKNYKYAHIFLGFWQTIDPAGYESRKQGLLFAAAKKGTVEVIAVLLHYMNGHILDENKRTPLHYLSESGVLDVELDFNQVVDEKEVLGELIKQGCSPLQRDAQGQSPLMLAIQDSNKPLFKCLLNNLSLTEEVWGQVEEALLGFDDLYKEDEDKKAILKVAMSYGFRIDQDSFFFNKLFVLTEWKLLLFCYEYYSDEELLSLFYRVFEHADKDFLLAEEDTLSSLSDTLDVLLPKMKKFILALKEKADLNRVDQKGQTCLHACIVFFEKQIKKIEELRFARIQEMEETGEEDDFEDEAIEALNVIGPIYLTLVESLATPINTQMKDQEGNTPLDLIADRESEAYQSLFNRLQPIKKKKSNRVLPGQ